MEITINPLDIKLYLDRDDSVMYIKQKINEMMNIPIRLQRLIYKARILDDDMQLAKYNIKDMDTLVLVIKKQD